MRRAVLLAIMVSLAPVSNAQLRRDRTTAIQIPETTEIQGYPCAKGTVSFYDEGRLRACVLAHSAAFGEAVVAAGSAIHLLQSGAPSFVFLKQNTEIRGYTCRGRDTDYMTTFYPNGKLKVCWQAADQVVQGVPCAKAAIFFDVFGVGEGTKFYDTGELKSCRLSSDFAPAGQRFSKGERIFLDREGKPGAGPT